jgi:hypothetical protein
MEIRFHSKYMCIDSQKLGERLWPINLYSFHSLFLVVVDFFIYFDYSSYLKYLFKYVKL